MLDLDKFHQVSTPLLELTPGDYILNNGKVYIYLGRAWSHEKVGYNIYIARRDDPESLAHWTRDYWKGNHHFTKLVPFREGA